MRGSGSGSLSPLVVVVLVYAAGCGPIGGPDVAPVSGPASRRRVICVTRANEPAWPSDVERIEYVSPLDGRSDWATALPPAGPANWIIFIHGHGSTAGQLYTRPDLRDTWLPLFRERGLGILTVNLRGNAWMSPAAAHDLHELLDWARPHYRMKRRIFLGGSMGGTSNLIYAVIHPGDADAVVALCPAADPAEYWRWCRGQTGPPVLADIAAAIEQAYGGPPGASPAYARHSVPARADRLTMPVYVAHGARDAIIPVSQSRQLAGVLAGRSSFHYKELPDGDHDAPLRLAEEGLDWVMRRLNRPGGHGAR